MAVGACGRADDLRVESAVHGDLGAELDELLAAVAGMAAQGGRGQPEVRRAEPGRGVGRPA
jgi:hypothetical protein